ncbi:MAG: homoserine dehydrogenase [Desulfuromonadales bacterium]|uniref:homoserine dehydrogenase n=1 Tax=Desulfuromonas sp. KJ2020 TaxID=2919173 RepID=UPI000325E46D|nr:homoserine dehydrogenase [Desulfuromonas sp. KJ2020]MCP3177849.1 homoserine dehydrogenase [Desulfuromonas sp. KJ2020]
MQSINIGLLGFGTIGTGVVRLVQKNAKIIEQRLGCKVNLVKIADLDIVRDRGVSLAEGMLTTDANEVVSHPDIHVVVELIGGYEPARSLVLKAIQNGKHVVTANKALLAVHGQEILQAAEKHRVEVLFEAAVGGGIPIISAIKENLCGNNFHSVFGIFNGTCNYILTRMTEDGEDFSSVLKEAQAKGYAEADPTFDVEGIDTAHKLALLISLCFGTRVDFSKVYTEGISQLSLVDIEFARQMGYKIKLLAIGKEEGGQIEARVHPTMIPDDYPLAQVDGVLNAVRLVGDFVGPVTLQGAGAGMDATASAVMGDVMSLGRNILQGIKTRSPVMGYCPASIQDLPIKSMDDIVGPYYLRFAVMDRPGVLAQIAGILGAHDISIASMIQPDRQEGLSVPVVLVTHDAREGNIKKALDEIDALEVIREKSHLIRIEGSLD